MEQLLETIELDTDESNELLFKVRIEGADRAPIKVRLVCETGDVSYMFKGESTPEVDVVRFTVPSMRGKIREGTYPARVEVFVENRYFAPVLFNIDFKQIVKVVAESVSVVPKRQEPRIMVSAEPIKAQSLKERLSRRNVLKALDGKIMKRFTKE